MNEKIERTDEQWREQLTTDQYKVLRQKGTEPPFTGAYWDVKADGTYRCAACDAPLFTSATKYDSGTGWPSFYEPVSNDAVRTETDTSHGMIRTEAVCGTCGSHLGHVFDDGPMPTGQRYCINSVSLDFEEAGAQDDLK
jgi:peptide-methionine (R)-S-oxide reductase